MKTQGLQLSGSCAGRGPLCLGKESLWEALCSQGRTSCCPQVRGWWHHQPCLAGCWQTNAFCKPCVFLLVGMYHGPPKRPAPLITNPHVCWKPSAKIFNFEL